MVLSCQLDQYGDPHFLFYVKKKVFFKVVRKVWNLTLFSLNSSRNTSNAIIWIS